MSDAGREVAPADYPPELQWEGAVWWLFQRISTQVRYRAEVTGYSGIGQPIITSVPAGLDYNPAIALMQSLGWPLDLGLELLQAAELEALLKVD